MYFNNFCNCRFLIMVKILHFWIINFEIWVDQKSGRLVDQQIRSFINVGLIAYSTKNNNKKQKTTTKPKIYLLELNNHRGSNPLSRMWVNVPLFIIIWLDRVFTGYLMDATGEYTASFFTLGGLEMVSIILVLQLELKTRFISWNWLKNLHNAISKHFTSIWSFNFVHWTT